MDEDRVLSSESARHVSVCADCAEFQETAADVLHGYRHVVRAGIERLRRVEPPRLYSRRAWTRWLLPLTAALLCCWGTEPPAPPALVQSAPAPSPRIWPLDEDLSFLSIRDPLPVRLDDPYWPAAPEVELPVHLRF
jgi:hypothetical protein